mgnify:CR=1 FL=1
MSALSSDERLAKIKYDANLRHDLVHKMPDDEHTRRVKEWLPKTFLMHKGFDYEPSPVDNICDIAAKKGVEPLEVALEAHGITNQDYYKIIEWRNYCVLGQPASFRSTQLVFFAQPGPLPESLRRRSKYL